MLHSTPAAPAVRETLERLLASETFGRSERARELLRYLVEQEQAGEADKLKGFSIAVDVFGRDAEFDSSTDAVVRVQAGRLRDLLQQYFETEGKAEPIRIVIPRGSYVPAYEWNAIRLPAPQAATVVAPEPPPAAGGPEEQASPSAGGDATTAAFAPALFPQRQLRFLWLAIGVVIAMLAVLLVRQDENWPVAYQSWAESGGKASLATDSVASIEPLDALPVVYLVLKSNDAAPARVAQTMRNGLAGFDTIDFIGRDVAAQMGAGAASSTFFFEIDAGSQPGSVTVELEQAGTGRVLMARKLNPSEIDAASLEDTVAGLLSASIPASGVLYSYLDQSQTASGLARCLLLNDDYYLDPNAQTHRAAYGCFENLAARDVKSPLVYSEMAVLEMEGLTDFYGYPAGANPEQAMALALRAVQMGPTSPYAHRAYGYMNSRLGNSDESIRWMKKAYELNTYDLSMAAAYAYGLIFAGKYHEGTPIMARAVEASSAHPNWWDYGLFIGRFMQDDMQAAAQATTAFAPMEMKSHYLAARLIAARFNGDEKTAAQLRTEIGNRFPKFFADPRATLVERKYPPDLTERLVRALRDAGLGVDS